MTPKEKAQELFDSMFNEMPHPITTNAETYIIAKRCAIAVVNDAIKDYESTSMFYCSKVKILPKIYWTEVKQEINNL